MQNCLQNHALWLKIMRITFTQTLLLVIFTGMTYATNVKAQEVLNKKVSLNFENREVTAVLQKLEQLTEIKFIFSPQVIKSGQKISVNFSNEKFGTVLERVLRPLNIKYEVSGKYIMLSDVITESPKLLNSKKFELPTIMADVTVMGTVTDGKGQGIPGVSVLVKGTTKGVSTDLEGKYKIALSAGTHVLIFSGVGYKKVEKSVSIGSQDAVIDVVMQDDNLQLDQVVVTTSGTPKSKLESSVAVTTISAKMIEQRPPLNSMDLLKAIPGLSVESSGGDGPGSVRARGLPVGSFVFVGVEEDGAAVIPTGFISSPSADQFFKVDLTIKNVEAVRGGEAAMLLASTAGALMNIISNTGGDKLESKIKYTRGLSQNSNRFDFNIGGPLAPKWKFNIGGFYRKDDGIKPANFTANDGGLIKANITYEINKNSYIRFYGKYLNDKTAFLVPSFYSYDGSGQGLALPYFDPLTQTLAPKDYTTTLNTSDGGSHVWNLADGNKTLLTSEALEFKITTKNEWTIRNIAKLQQTNYDFNSALVTGAVAFDPAKSYYYLDGTQVSNPTGYYTGQSIGVSNNKNTQFVDNLTINKQIGNNALSLGAGLHTLDLQTTGYSALTYSLITNNPSLIKVGSNAGTGFLNAAVSGYQNGTTTISSLWANDEMSIGNLNLDLGLRFDNSSITGVRLVNKQPFITTNTTPFDYSKLNWTSTIGLNYKLNEANAIYTRWTKTYSGLTIADLSNPAYVDGSVKNRDIWMGELGYKMNTNNFSLFATLVYARLINATVLMSIPDNKGGFISASVFPSSRNLSAEIEAIYTPTKNLNFRFTNTIQNTIFTSFSTIAPANARADLAGKEYSWAGNVPERIPNIISALSVSYTTKFLNYFAQYRYIGNRWSSPADLYDMGGYNEVSAGIDIKPTKALAFRIWGDNLLNSRGLTEGNIRGDQFLANGAFPMGSAQIGRIILPRSLWASVSFSF